MKCVRQNITCSKADGGGGEEYNENFEKFNE